MRRIEQLSPWIYLALILISVAWVSIIMTAVIHQQHQIKETAKLIQKQRTAYIYNDCLAQNNRHQHTLSTLNTILKKSGVTKENRKTAAPSTLLLIDALAPIRDCVKVATEATGLSPLK